MMREKHTILQRITCMVLVMVMTVSVWTVSDSKKAKAAGETQKITLGLASAGNSWDFTHTELSDEYQGTEEPWVGVSYQFNAYKDDNTTPEKVWMEFVGATAYIYDALAYETGIVPTKSLYIPAGTLMSECVYDGDTNTTTLVENGKTLELTEDVNIIYTNGSWKQTNQKNVSLSFRSVASNGEWLFDHSSLPESYQGKDNWGATVKYQFAAFEDYSEQAGTAWLEFEGSTVHIYPGAFPGQNAPGKAFFVPAGTVLYECTYNSDGTTTAVGSGRSLVLTNDLDFVYSDGAWQEAKRVSLTLQEKEDRGNWLFSHSVLPSEYQGTDDWKKIVKYAFTYQKNGYEDTMTGWMEFVGSTVYIYPHGFSSNGSPTTEFYIPQGTVLYECTYDGETKTVTAVDGGKKLHLTEALDLVYREGAWNAKNQAEVTLTFRERQGAGDWVLDHSPLPQEFQGADDDWDNSVSYQFKAYKDGSTAPGVGWMQFVGSTAYIWLASFPGEENPTNHTPKSRFYMPEGTVLYECVYSDDLHASQPVTGGKTLVLTEELDIVYLNGTWQKNPYKEIELYFEEVNDSKQILFEHTKLSAKYQGSGKWGEGETVRYQFDAYIDGATTAKKIWMEFVGETAYIYPGVFTGVKLPAKSLYISKGTLLKEYIPETDTLVTNGKCLKLAEDCYMVPDNGKWYQHRVPDSQYDLVTNGTSDYKIIIPASATENETFAAEELQYYTKQATGITLPIYKEGSVAVPDKYISIGNTTLSKNAGINPTYEQLKTSGYVIKTIGNDCYIKGYTDMGTRNSAFGWLEYTFGYVCYSSKEIVTWERKNRKLPAFNMTELPTFDIRQTTGEVGVLDFENSFRYRFNKAEEIYASFGTCHNSFTFINPQGTYDYTKEEYKDWYSETMHENIQHGHKMLPAQLCYSNQEWWPIYLSNLKNYLKPYTHPYMIIGMEDNNEWCTCDACVESLKKYGSNAAVMVKFVNYLQEELNAWCEEINRSKISLIMFAYHKCKEAPAKWDASKYTYVPVDDSVKLHPDAGVMYAPVNASFIYSLNDPINAEYKQQLRGWRAVADTIAGWTYTCYPGDTLMFYDSFDIMKENIQLLLDYGTIAIHDQTAGINVDGNSGWDMAKTFVIAQLQWDKDQDVDKLLKDFFEHYYQDAADIMLNLMEYNSVHLKENIYPRLKYIQPTDDNYLEVEGNIFVQLLDNEYLAAGFTEEYVNGALDKINQAFATIEKYKYTDPERYEKLYDRILLEKLQFSYLDACLHQGDGRWGRTPTEDRWQFRIDYERMKIVTVRDPWTSADQFGVIWNIPTYNSVKLTHVDVGSDGKIYLKGTITDGPDAGKTLAEVYGDGGNASGELQYHLNGLDIKDTVTWKTTKADSKHGNAVLCLQSDHVKNNISGINEFVISEGTKVMLGAKTPMYIEEGVQLVEKPDGEYVDVGMLDILVQDNYDTAPTGTKKYDMRFVASVNSLEYAKAGFVFSLENTEPTKGGNKCVTREVTTVYENIKGGINSTNFHVSSLYDDYSKYMYAFEIAGVPAKQKIYVRAYVQLEDGTILYGEARVVTAPKAK